MKAAVIHGPKKVTYDTVADPTLMDDRDLILKVTATAICGSDLHIYTGGIPQPRPMGLGHEFMGIVEEVGKGVTNLKQGDRVVVPFPIACGHCFFCNHEMPGHCEHSNPEHYGPEGGMMTEKGGALFGYTDLYGSYDGDLRFRPRGHHGGEKRLVTGRRTCDHRGYPSISVVQSRTGSGRRYDTLGRQWR
jgi:threonine dehydrogenase-like Zn-dependent dehydrogenase